MRWLFKSKKSWVTVITAAIIAFVLYVVNAATEGIIAKFATDTLFPKLVTILTMTQWPPFVTPAFFVAALVGGYTCWRIYKTARKELESTADIYDNLIKMDDDLFWWIQKMKEARDISVDELDKRTKKAIEYLLFTATIMFSKEVHAGSLFILDHADNKLKIWAHYRMGQEEIEGAQFDMSQTAKPPVGMARVSYLKNSIEVGHIEKKGKRLRCTNDNYVKIGTLSGPTPSDPPPPPYSSLICVSVTHSLTSQVPLGVISFNSHDKTTFDDPEINLLVKKIADRIAQALVIYQFLK